jgi:hypothetical protein
MEQPTPSLLSWMLRKLIRGIDACLRRGIGIVEFERGEDALLRIGVARAERAVRLRDGTQLQPGDPLLELHLWNEHLPMLPSGGPSLRWAASTRRQITHSLRRLAVHLQRVPDLWEAKALRIQPAFAGRNLARNLNWIAAKHGFESIEDLHKPVLTAGARRWFDSLWLWLLTWAFNPHSLRGRRFRRTRREFWISRARFIALYGEPREVAREQVRAHLQSIGAQPRAG